MKGIKFIVIGALEEGKKKLEKMIYNRNKRLEKMISNYHDKKLFIDILK